MIILLVVLSSFLTAAGFMVGGFLGGLLAGFGISLVTGGVIGAVVQRFLARRVQRTAVDLASALGPQGEAILQRFTKK